MTPGEAEIMRIYEDGIYRPPDMIEKQGGLQIKGSGIRDGRICSLQTALHHPVVDDSEYGDAVHCRVALYTSCGNNSCRTHRRTRISRKHRRTMISRTHRRTRISRTHRGTRVTRTHRMTSISKTNRGARSRTSRIPRPVVQNQQIDAELERLIVQNSRVSSNCKATIAETLGITLGAERYV